MSQLKRKLTAFSAMLAFLSLSSAVAYGYNPGEVLGKTGNMNISDSGKLTNVNINGAKGAVGQVDWAKFSVKSDETVNFGFSGLSQTIINRVLGGQTSEIYGKLTNSCTTGGCTNYADSGKVILINPAGVLFGQGSSVDLNSFTVSTFDFNGAKNLQNMTEAQLNTYQADVLNKLSPLASVSAGYDDFGQITFDSSYTTAFGEYGINYTGNGTIALNGTTFANFKDGVIDAKDGSNKSIALVADNVTYKDSVLRTGQNFNYVTDNTKYSDSNVKIVTADGVTFNYLRNGAIKGAKNGNQTVNNYDLINNNSGVVRNISVDNSGLAQYNTNDGTSNSAIVSGNVDIVNNSASGSKINIADSIIKATKLINDEDGNIYIAASTPTGAGNARTTVTGSRLETLNTIAYDANGNEIGNTRADNGGVIKVIGTDVTVDDSTLKAVGSKVSSTTNAGSITINATGNTGKTAGYVTINDSQVIGANDVSIYGVKDIDVENSLIYAKDANFADYTNPGTSNIQIVTTRKINVDNSDLYSSGDVDLLTTYSNGNLYSGQYNAATNTWTQDGGVIVNNSTISADKDISLQSGDTTLDDSTLVYDTITFTGKQLATSAGNKGGGTGYGNNLTIKDGTTFTDKNNGAVSRDIDISTDGNLTVDNGTLKISSYSITFGADSGTKDGYAYTVKTTTQANPNNVTLTTTKNANAQLYNQTKNDLTIKNNSNINPKVNFTATSANDLTVANSTVTAGTDAALTAAKDYNQTNSLITAKEGNATVNAANATIAAASKIEAGEDVRVTATTGDVAINASTINAGSDTTEAVDDAIGSAVISSTNGNVTIANSTIQSEDQDVEVSANNGTITINGTSKLEAVEDVNIADKGNLVIDSTAIVAGSDTLAGDPSETSGSANITSTQGDIAISNSTVTSEDDDVNVTAEGGSVTIADSTLEAVDDVDVTAQDDTNLNNTNVIAGTDSAAMTDPDETSGSANIASTGGNVNITESNVVSEDEDINVVADNGAVNVTDSTLEAVEDVNITGKNDVSLTSTSETKTTNVIAGSDSATMTDPDETSGSANITSTSGSVLISDHSTVISEDEDVNITSYNTITFGDTIDHGATIVSSEDMSFKSTNGDINGDKAAMPSITFGVDDATSRLTFDAKGSNNFTAANDSFKAVNVDYIAGTSTNISADKDIQLVDTTFKSPQNNIIGKEDIVLNDVTIKNATSNPANTKTYIYTTGGDVTTQDITGSAADDKAAAAKTYIQDTDIQIDRGANYNQTTLDINKTKLVIKTNTVQTEEDPAIGSVTLQLKNADNTNAGIEITAENNVYDENYTYDENGVSYGPVVNVDAVDNKLAISRIVTDKLTLHENDTFYAAPVDLTDDEIAGLPANTPHKGYIEVRDYMGFNMDDDFSHDPSAFDYTDHYVDGQRVIDGNVIDTKEKHTIKFANGDSFILIYGRPVADNPLVGEDSLISLVKLPKEQFEISKNSAIADGTADQSGNVVSAAARISVGDEENEDDEEDEYDEDEE